MQTPQQYKMSRTSSVQDDIDEIVKNKNKMLIDDSRQLVNSLKHNKKSRLSYTKLKHEGIIYHKGQNLCIKADNKQEYVAKLVRILLLVDDEDRHYPLIKVQWYCKKNELKNVTKEQLDCISDNEVFKTNEFDYIEIDSIISLAQILTYQEFDQLEIMNDTTYFTRATFQNSQFSPPLEQWEKTCICQKPPNPDLKYILCDACEKWFHLKCVDITKDKAERLKAYICPNCQS